MKPALFLPVVLMLCLAAGCAQKTQYQSLESLKTAYAREAASVATYNQYAAKAREEKLEPVARLFTALAASEETHAANIKKAILNLGETVAEPPAEKAGILSTKENLATAINSEAFFIDTLYPVFILLADKEQLAETKQVFTWAFGTEKKHQTFLRELLKDILDGKELSTDLKWYVCPTCGDTYKGPVADKVCDFCGTNSEKFKAF